MTRQFTLITKVCPSCKEECRVVKSYPNGRMVESIDMVYRSNIWWTKSIEQHISSKLFCRNCEYMVVGRFVSLN